ncbi:MAG: NAD(P)H-dependent oxidoreductase [Verrucomicrobiales bacterium]|nr:NAD(P)H-dependent oxidoreductase [Verrucomicrobiales bacterium]
MSGSGPWTEGGVEGLLLRQLRWRYAVKSFDPARPIPAATWEALEEALVLTPSSFGLQPWRFLVLTDPALRRQLVPHSWGQSQVVDCSHYVVCCLRRGLGLGDIERYLQRISEVRGGEVARLAGLRSLLVKTLVDGPLQSSIDEWAARQVYIALGNFMTAAAVAGVDTCPMEGIEPARYDEILGLTATGYATVVCCAAGYRSASDKYASLPKVRYPRSEVIERR